MDRLSEALELTHVSEDDKIPDDVWEKFTRDSERDIRDSAPKEPSARAREVTERLRRDEARGELPEGWRTGPAWQEKKSRRGLWGVLGVAVAVAVAVVAVKPSLVPGDPFGGNSSDGGGAVASALPVETAAPTAAPSAEAPEIPTLDDPFAGSPAKRWADGAAGIVVPKAKAVGGRSAAKTEQALELTKKLLVASNLDPATLRGERPEAALDVLDPVQKDVRGLLETGLSIPGQILAVTFTNKAAREMKERIGALVGGAVEGMPWLGTFHAIGVKILRRHAELVGLKSGFTILDTDDQIRLIKQVIESEGLDKDRWPARQLAA